MKVFRFWANGSKFAQLGVVKSDDWSMFDQLTGASVTQTWQPMVFDLEPRRKKPDFWSLAGVPIVPERTWTVLKDFLGNEIEPLPAFLSKTNEALLILHPLGILDCLDQQNSEFRQFRDGGVGAPVKYRFISKCINGRRMFRLHETWKVETFITEPFQLFVEAHNLGGLIFSQSSLVDDISE